MIYFLLNSDNYEDEIVSRDEYLAIRFEMSTGDFHTHTIKEIDPREYIIDRLRDVQPPEQERKTL